LDSSGKFSRNASIQAVANQDEDAAGLQLCLNDITVFGEKKSPYDYVAECSTHIIILLLLSSYY
jgi:hypothetical protein